MVVLIIPSESGWRNPEARKIIQARARKQACLMVLEGHEEVVQFSIYTNDGNLLESIVECKHEVIK